MLSVSGCSHWVVEGMAPATLVAERKPREIRVLRADLSKLILSNPVVAGDSIRGRSGAVARADILAIEVMKVSAGATFGFILMLPLIALLVCVADDCLDFSVGM